MNIDVTFHIVVGKYDKGKTYRMLVEHYYSSPQVERFKINGNGQKFIRMEKRLNIHKQPWKVIDGTVDLSNVEQSIQRDQVIAGANQAINAMVTWWKALLKHVENMK